MYFNIVLYMEWGQYTSMYMEWGHAHICSHVSIEHAPKCATGFFFWGGGGGGGRSGWALFGRTHIIGVKQCMVPHPLQCTSDTVCACLFSLSIDSVVATLGDACTGHNSSAETLNTKRLTK